MGYFSIAIRYALPFLTIARPEQVNCYDFEKTDVSDDQKVNTLLPNVSNKSLCSAIIRSLWDVVGMLYYAW